MSRAVIATALLVAGLAPGPARGQVTVAHRPTSLLRSCGSCHVGHGQRRSTMLPEIEEDLCYRCHGNAGKRLQQQRNGLLVANVELRDVSVDFRLPYRHPVERTTGVHHGAEILPEIEGRTPRHVECADCHRVHRTRIPVQQSRLPRRSSLDGQSPEYELCYRCHSTSLNLPRTSSNVARRFRPTNPSYHPVEAAGTGRNVPSLRAPMTVNSLISCGDCHGNDSGRGIHGSRYPFLLRRPYVSLNRTPEGPEAYALCYDCHDRQTLYSGAGFSQHARHVQQARVPCAVCHDAHGSLDAPHLIEFEPRVVQADPTTGRLEYVSTGPGRGRCYVSCHGQNHSGTEYCEPGGQCGSTTEVPFNRQEINRRRQRLRRSPFSF